MNKGTVLVVEDDKAIQNLIGTTLEIFDYNYLISSNAKDGILKATSHNPDVIILDLGLPDMDGLEVIRKIRSFSLVPIIIVSARTDNADKITALDAGADDYLTKPFNTEELLARVRVSMRHKMQSTQVQPQNNIFTNGNLKIDYDTNCVYVNDNVVHLTAIEYKLLCLFMENPDQILSSEQILGNLWDCNENYIDNNSLTVYIRRLRTKIEDNPGEPKRIVTVRGMGYKWNTEEAKI